jgi:hypothetical protein
MHHICAIRINNDNVYQSTEVVANNKNIHLSSNVVKEKVGDLLLNMCSAFQSNNYDNILKCVHGLLYAHSNRGTKTNGYLDRQWYDHIDTVKGVQL